MTLETPSASGSRCDCGTSKASLRTAEVVAPAGRGLRAWFILTPLVLGKEGGYGDADREGSSLAHLGIERVRRTPHLAYSFLRRTGL